MCEFNIKLQKEPKFKYGQKLYIVEPDPTTRYHDKSFSEKCPVCDNKRTISYRGYEIKCSYCDRLGANYVTVTKYVLREYYVNKIVIEGSNTASGLRSSLPEVTEIRAFTRWNNSFDGYKTRDVLIRNIDPEGDLEALLGKREYDSFVFTSKEAAQKALEIIMNNERTKLEKFNEQHGTTHEFPY